MNKLQQVVSEIKSYGKRYLSLNESADSCPLCETPFSFDELSTRVSNIAQAVDENVAIDKLNSQLIQLDSDLSKANDTMTNIQHIESGILILLESEYLQLNLLEIGKIFNSSKSGLDKKNEDQSKTVAIKAGVG